LLLGMRLVYRFINSRKGKEMLYATK